MKVPFNSPYMTGQELEYIAQAYNLHKLSGNGQFTQRCHKILQQQVGSQKVLLTHSCTAALEMASILCDLQPGDEVITVAAGFPTTVFPILQNNCIPVFLDINLVTSIEEITMICLSKTKLLGIFFSVRILLN